MESGIDKPMWRAGDYILKEHSVLSFGSFSIFIFSLSDIIWWLIASATKSNDNPLQPQLEFVFSSNSHTLAGQHL